MGGRTSHSLSQNVFDAIIIIILFFSIMNIISTFNVTTKNDDDTIYIDTAAVVSESESESTSWNKAIKEAEKELLGFDFESYNDNANDNANANANMPSCLLPDNEGMKELVKKLLIDDDNSSSSSRRRNNTTNTNKSNTNTNTNTNTLLLPLPILNMGMPKTGSTSLYEYFNCIGIKTTHWNINNINEYEGICMRNAAHQLSSPLETCAPKIDALMQMDIASPLGTAFIKSPIPTYKEKDECFFPQLSLLNEIHNEKPSSTFIINFRPINDWIKSVSGWGDMLYRFSQCNLPNLPYNVPSHILVNQMTNTTTNNNNDNNNNTAATAAAAKVIVNQIMIQFFCSHVIHLRNFVNQYPSHTLIELDLYDTDQTSYVLNTLFPQQQQQQQQQTKRKRKVCWEQANKSSEVRKAKAKTNQIPKQ